VRRKNVNVHVCAQAAHGARDALLWRSERVRAGRVGVRAFRAAHLGWHARGLACTRAEGRGKGGHTPGVQVFALRTACTFDVTAT